MRKLVLFGFFIAGLLSLSGCFAPPTGGLRAVISTIPGLAQGEYPFTVTFDASPSSGDIVEYLWVFGDGATGSGLTASHTYADRGTYTVFLTVVDRGGLTAQAQTAVSVHSKRPVARFTVSPASDIRVGMAVTFDASGSYDPDGTIREYLWSFGDGVWSSSSSPAATHTYRDVGSYTVTLVVEDAEGDVSDPATRLIPVSRGGCCGN